MSSRRSWPLRAARPPRPPRGIICHFGPAQREACPISRFTFASTRSTSAPRAHAEQNVKLAKEEQKSMQRKARMPCGDNGGRIREMTSKQKGASTRINLLEISRISRADMERSRQSELIICCNLNCLELTSIWPSNNVVTPQRSLDELLFYS